MGGVSAYAGNVTVWRVSVVGGRGSGVGTGGGYRLSVVGCRVLELTFGTTSVRLMIRVGFHLRHPTPDTRLPHFFLFTSCFTSSFPIGLCAEMMTAAVPSANDGMVQRTMAVPSADVFPRKMIRGGSTVEMTFTSIAAAGIGLWERLFFAATRNSTGVPAKNSVLLISESSRCSLSASDAR